jgi:hypothetical protein
MPQAASFYGRERPTSVGWHATATCGWRSQAVIQAATVNIGKRPGADNRCPDLAALKRPVGQRHGHP